VEGKKLTIGEMASCKLCEAHVNNVEFQNLFNRYIACSREYSKLFYTSLLRQTADAGYKKSKISEMISCKLCVVNISNLVGQTILIDVQLTKGNNINGIL